MTRVTVGARLRTGRPPAGVTAGMALVGCLALAAAAPGPAAAQSAPAAGPAAPAPEQARAADSFVDSVGVVTHFRYTETAYADSDAIIDGLVRLGVRHVRDGLPVDPDPTLLAALRMLPAHGIKAQFTLGSPDLPKGAPLPSGESVAAALEAADVRGVAESLENPNEWDLKSDSPDWVAQLLRFDTEFRAAIATRPDYAGVPFVGPSAGNKKNVVQLQGFQSLIDIDNLHNYAAGGTPEEDLALELERGRAVSPGKPLYVTETGYHTALAQRGRQKPVSDQAKADYTLRTLLENYSAGVARTYMYQFADNKADPANEDQEQHFGLLRSDLTPTPAYDALRGLLAGLADPGPTFTPTPLSLSVSGGPDVQHLLLQKRDGSYAVVLWRRGVIYEAGHDVQSTEPVTVSLGGGARTAALQPAGGAVEQLGAVSEVKGTLGNAPVLVSLAATTGSGSGVGTFGPTAPGQPSASAPAATTSSHTGLIIGGGLLALLAAVGAGLFVLLRRRRSDRPGGRVEDSAPGLGDPGAAGGADRPDPAPQRRT